MFGQPLQLAGAELTPWTSVLLAGRLIEVALGLAIAYIALQGYRSNRSRPMLFIGLGFILLMGLPPIFVVVFFTSPPIGELETAAATLVAEITGMICILYALRMET